MYPPETTFRVSMCSGSRVSIASADLEYAKAKLTSARLRAVPEGQPPRLPKDFVALAMHKHRNATVSMSGFANNPRKFVALRMNTPLPLRPAEV